jgi:SAM-dependent methyltransferase
LRPSGVKAFDRLVTGDGPFAVLECAACSYGVTDPQLSGAELERYYGGEYFHGFYGSGAPSGPLERARAAFRRHAAARRFARPPLALPRGAPGRVLDVGCGSGELLAHYATRGWEIFGIEPAATVAERARRRGATVHEGTLEDQPWQRATFDLIVFSHSLEHMSDPLAALRVASELLVPAGGTLAIAVPNWRCWQRWLFRGRWFHLDLPRHLWHFSPRALSVAAERLELEPVEIATSATVISVAYSLHYVIAGRWTPGWRLWLAYALGAAAFPAVAVINRLAGADCCYALLRRTE